MKYLLYSLLIIPFLFSCADDEDVSSTALPFDIDFVEPTPSFQPLAVGNYWVYQVAKVDTLGNEEILANDTIQIVGDTIINNKIYYVKVDNNLGLGPSITSYVRDSSGYLVTLSGSAIFSSTVFDEVINTWVNGPAKIEYSMQSGLQTVSVPLGDFECLNYQGVVTAIDDEDYAPRLLFSLYSEDVGLVTSNIFFFSSRMFTWERRLIDFHLE